MEWAWGKQVCHHYHQTDRENSRSNPKHHRNVHGRKNTDHRSSVSFRHLEESIWQVRTK